MKFIKNLILFVIAFIIAINIQNYSHSNTLKFAQLSDIHYTTKKKDTTFKSLSKSKELLEDAIFQINTTPNIDFVMITGDLVDVPKIENLQNVIPLVNTLTSPWYLSFGNHDIAISGKLTKEKFVEILKDSNKSFDFENGYYSFSPKKGFKIIVLDPIIDNKITGNGYIPPEQVKWLDNNILNSKDETILVFMHTPVKEPYKSAGHRLKNAKEIQELFEKHKKPIAVFSGHYHASKIEKENNILYVSSPALVTYPNAFRIIEVKNTNNEILFDFKFIETTKKEIQTKGKLKIFSSQTYAGEEKDKNGIYSLKK